MQVANATSVLGNFQEAVFSWKGVTSKFTTRDGRFFVTTDGPDGTLHEYSIPYTFGVDPLQQYLIDLGGGRLQALGIAWDTRPKADGGQRWFHLYPEQVLKPGDPLHWTGIDQNWNHMCAECHSTNLRKNYRAESGTYETTWSEINVACEACHGPGSAHVAWAQATPSPQAKPDNALGLSVRFGDRRTAAWAMDPTRGIAVRSGPAAQHQEEETCGLCHARRGMERQGHVPGRQLADTHRVALLEDGLYYADGQIRDEVYEYGSFRQSRMFQAGVTCGDCHDPHRGGRRAEGNALCLGCHDGQRFDSASHHFHPTGAGSQCVACHMPTKTYMQIDRRHDHSFRVPRPDLSLRLGSPNACTQCHADRDNTWAVDAIRRWYGDKPWPQHYGEAIHAARGLRSEGEVPLARWATDPTTPPIARATLLDELGQGSSTNALAPLQVAIKEEDPQLRRTAAEAVAGLEAAQRAPLLKPLLGDPAHGVRIAAGRALAGVPSTLLGDAATARDAALREYRAAQAVDSDRPESHLNLGNLEAELGDVARAEASYRTALQRDPTFVPVYVNLADLLRASGRDGEVENLLRGGLTRNPDAAVLHHSLGLFYVRQKNLGAALASLRRAVDLAPRDARFAYVCAVALDSAGRTGEAIELVATALRQVPGEPSLLQLRAQLQGRAE